MQQCPARWFFTKFGGKWTLLVLGSLYAGPRRFSQIRSYLAPISERMLILALKNLEDDGLICRESDVSLKKNTYRLTTSGNSLLGHLTDLHAWMGENGAAILAHISGPANSLIEDSDYDS